MGWPVTGSARVTVEPGGYTVVLPAMLKPVTCAVVPAGMLALASTLPVAFCPMGVDTVSSASV